MIGRGRSAVWICNYDWPLLCGLRYNFGRYSTELVSAIAEACIQCGAGGLYLTGQLPFPLYRIALTDGAAAESVDEDRKACVRCILEKHFADRGKATWQEWLNYFEKKKRPPAVLGHLDLVVKPGGAPAVADLSTGGRTGSRNAGSAAAMAERRPARSDAAGDKKERKGRSDAFRYGSSVGLSIDR